MEIIETWGIRLCRARQFFEGQTDVLYNGDGSFSLGSCRITLTELPDRELGSLRFPQTVVKMQGGDEDTRLIHHRFEIHFLSAGG